MRFSVNDGPEHFSDTINFSPRSLAIRTDLPVKAGDRVRAEIEHFPTLEGVVARIWDEGFAIILSEAAMNAKGVSFGHPGELHLASALADGPVAGRLTPLKAPHASWFSITSRGQPHTHHRRLLLITTAPLSRDTIHSIWLSVAGTRWLARAIDARRSDGQSILVMRVNDWQLKNAAEYGLTFTVIMKSMTEWTASAPPEAVSAHLSAPASEIARSPEHKNRAYG